jgi:hypothetical protein
MSSTATKSVRSEDGTTIAYDGVGAGPAVAVVGGGPTDRLANAPLAALLADRLTVYGSDRRGRRESGGAEACTLERECEDLGAVIATAGGVAAAFGTSSDAVLTPEAASRGVPLSSLVLWEPSYVVDDSRTPPPAGLADSVAELVASGGNGDALELFFTGAVDMPAEAVAFMRSQPFWEGMEATAPALVHDITFMGDFSQPADRLGSVSAPTVVVDGGTTPWLTASAHADAAAVPGAARQTIAGQPHNVDPSAIAPVIAEWLSNAAAATRGRDGPCETGDAETPTRGATAPERETAAGGGGCDGGGAGLGRPGSGGGDREAEHSQARTGHSATPNRPTGWHVCLTHTDQRGA